MASASCRLEAHWARRGALSTLLVPVSWLFALVSAARRALYRHGVLACERFAVPVIVVGNLTVGGTGKTPLVIALIELLRAQGLTPGIASRGYGGRRADVSDGAQLVENGDAGVFGDEAVLMVERTRAPVAVAARRARAVALLLERHPQTDVVVCDDGLQHYGLARDLELVVFDERGAGNARLLPAGPLREPLARARRADALVLNGTNSPPPGLESAPRRFGMRLEPGLAYALAAPEQRRPLAQLPGTKILAAAGIGHPARFFSMLAAHGVRCDTLALPDHFDYRVNPFAEVAADCILITEKDAVKCRHLGDSRLWVVPVEALLDSGFAPFLSETLRACSSVGPAPA